MKRIVFLILLCPNLFSLQTVRGQLWLQIPIGSNTAFTPPSANQIGHWNISVSSSVTLSGSNVIQWNDLSGNGNNFTVSSGASAGTFSGSGASSALTFSSSSFECMSSSFALPNGVPYTIYIVLRQNSWSPNRWFFSGYGGGTSGYIGLRQISSSPEIQLMSNGATGATSTSLTIGTITAIAIAYNSPNSSINVGGTVSSAALTLPSNPGGITIGGNTDNGYSADVSFMEMYIYSTADNLTQMNNMLNSIIANW